MKKLLHFLVIPVILGLLPFKTYAIYDPTAITNNKFGMHILYPSEISEASKLVNSSGGDWGYVTIPIQSSDRNLDKWQQFMNDCLRFHVIPIIRIATAPDFINKSVWAKPTDYDVLDFANFLNDLNWPTKNRYLIVYNETNRGDEWGGSPNAVEYTEILDYAANIFKQRSSDFFIIAAGLDNASANIPGQSIDDYTYMRQMHEANENIFREIDGLSSHSYPNPGFSMPPSFLREGVYSFYYQQLLAKNLSGKQLPIFITETGWTSNKISQETQSQYYIQSFSKYWNDASVIAVTPFVFDGQQGPFTQFSFIKNGDKTKIYYALYNFIKNKGTPPINQEIKADFQIKQSIPTQNFKTTSIKSIFQKIGNSQKTLFKWILGI